MFVIMGATGHVGSVVVDTLLAQDHDVLALIHSPEKAAELEAKGARSALIDAHDPEALRSAFSGGRRAFLLNPPANPGTDTDKEESATARAILRALDGLNLEKIVAASTMGAAAGEALQPRTGDSSILYEFEQGLAAQPIPAAINRGAYYLTNFDSQLDQIRKTGELQTMYPADFRLPMVDPRDLGIAAARRLTSGLDDVGIISIEAPVRPSWSDVALAFSSALGRDVSVVTIRREDWIEAFKAQGFSAAAADAYARMTAMALDGPVTPQSETEKGETTVDAYIEALVN